MDLSLNNLKRKFVGVWSTSEQTGQQVVRGSTIIFFERILIKGLYFVRTVILARLLFPNDFGLFGLAVLAMNVVDIFFQPALGSALIQRKEISRNYLDAAWSFGLVRNFFLALLLFFLAPLAGIFFHNSGIILFIKALAVIFIISGFENIGIIFFKKELKFNKQFFYDMSAIVAEVIAVIISAFILRNAGH